MLRTFAARAALAVAALLVVPACSKEGTVHFDITKSYSVSSATSHFGPEVKTVNLAQDASEAWSHRDKIKAVRITNVRVVGTNMNPATGNTGSGSFKVRPSGTTGAADVMAGDFNNVPLGNNTWLDAAGNGPLNDALNAALKGDGTISFVGEATATAPFTGTVQVQLVGDLDYKISAGL